jgi:DNA-binding NarL/FixJ family response regulator
MRILVVEDHPAMREAAVAYVRRALPEATTLEAGTLAEALEKAAVTPDLDLVLLDLDLPDSRELDTLRGFRQKFEDLRIVVVSARDDPETVLNALDLGARGYILKTVEGSAFGLILQLVRAGVVYVPDVVRKALSNPVTGRPDLKAERPAPVDAADDLELTPQQYRVARLMAAGKSHKAIARELGNLSIVTVQKHLSDGLYRALHVDNSKQALAELARRGIVFSRDF